MIMEVYNEQQTKADRSFPWRKPYRCQQCHGIRQRSDLAIRLQRLALSPKHPMSAHSNASIHSPTFCRADTYRRSHRCASSYSNAFTCCYSGAIARSDGYGCPDRYGPADCSANSQTHGQTHCETNSQARSALHRR